MKSRTVLISSFASALSIVLLIFTPSSVSADIDWTRGQPSIRIDDDGVACNESREKVVNWPDGGMRESSVCVTYGKDFDMAYVYGTRAGGSNAPLVRMHGNEAFSSLLGIADARLTSETNRVIYGTKAPPNPLVMIDDFMSVLNAEYPQDGDNSTPLSFKVNLARFDDKILPSTVTATGDKVISYQLSGNGRYVIAYFKDTGIVKYDTTNRQIIKVASVSSLTSWNSINQPRIEAVSDDGRFVFLAPSGQIIDTENCGDVNAILFDFHTQILHACRMRENAVIIHSLVAQAAEIQGAQFSEDGNTLKFFTVDSADGSDAIHRIVMGATDVKIIKYLALGDSYSSGEGDVSYSSGQTNYLPGTENRNECHISYRSYPFLLKEKWNVNFNNMRSVACSGAHVLSDYYGEGEYIGQHHELEGRSSDEKLSLRNDTLNNFAPGVIRQIDFVAKYKPDTITFTGGGNDIGFGEIIGYCANPQHSLIESCPQVSDPQISANLRRKIDDERSPLTEFITKIKEASPATKVYLIGYPQFVALDGCNDESPLLDKMERLMIRSSVTRLNNILKLVAYDTGVYYVDIEDSLDGGQICQTNSYYMTGPLKVLGRVVEGYTQEAYHPNAKGHKKMADAIDARIKQDDLSYTIIDIPTEKNGQRMVKMAITKDYAGVGSEQTITMDAGMFEEDGTVDAVMYSDRVPLAKIKVRHDGALNAKVKITSEIEPGMHLLTLTGKSIAGDILQVQQYITIYSEEGGIALTGTRTPLSLPDSAGAPNSMISTEAAAPLLQATNQRLLLDLGRGANYEKTDNESTVTRNIFMIPVTIILIIAIIVKGALYARKKER